MIVCEGVETSRPFRLGSGWPGPAPSPGLFSFRPLRARSSVTERRGQVAGVPEGDQQRAGQAEGARVRSGAEPPGRIAPGGQRARRPAREVVRYPVTEPDERQVRL